MTEIREALELAWADGYSHGATPATPRPLNPWSEPVSGIWRAMTHDQQVATLLFVEQRGDDLFAAPVTIGYTYADEQAVSVAVSALGEHVTAMVWLGLTGPVRWDVLHSKAAAIPSRKNLASLKFEDRGLPILNRSGRRWIEREELRAAMEKFAPSHEGRLRHRSNGEVAPQSQVSGPVVPE